MTYKVLYIWNLSDLKNSNEYKGNKSVFGCILINKFTYLDTWIMLRFLNTQFKVSDHCMTLNKRFPCFIVTKPNIS